MELYEFWYGSIFIGYHVNVLSALYKVTAGGSQILRKNVKSLVVSNWLHYSHVQPRLPTFNCILQQANPCSRGEKHVYKPLCYQAIISTYIPNWNLSLASGEVLHNDKRSRARETSAGFDRKSNSKTNCHRGIKYREELTGPTAGEIGSMINFYDKCSTTPYNSKYCARPIANFA